MIRPSMRCHRLDGRVDRGFVLIAVLVVIAAAILVATGAIFAARGAAASSRAAASNTSPRPVSAGAPA